MVTEKLSATSLYFFSVKMQAAAIVLCALLAYAAGQACPTIVTRAEWGARPPTSTTLLSTVPTSHTVIHHGESQGCTTQSACSAIVRSYQNYHMDTNGWSDIGYNFLVGEDGNAYEGRGWNNQGAHAPNYNSKSIGICFIGSFTTTKPNAIAISAAQKLIACGVGLDKIASTYKLVGHRQVTDTDCPGNALYAEIQTWAHWTSTP